VNNFFMDLEKKLRVKATAQVGDGTLITDIPPDFTVLKMKLALVEKLKEGLDSTASCLASFVPEDFAISKTAVRDDELLDEKVLIAEDQAVAKSGFSTADDGTLLVHLVNMKEQCEDKPKKDAKSGGSKKKKDDTKDPWGDVVVKTLDGADVKVAEQWKTKRVVLNLVRRFG